ncbi:hypothetical protein KP79_PYT11107 [Mizuhopecten yessoensis]|uniref:Uncharacterized protein n=1 Tax=Mizuhopecten yessoensis TaxID=6573 RepID=A0A210Q0C0_MIZYE|nr:hypothetical protein KP79_PYT11107 [Mizuhopecten yessoensis]
MKVSFVVLLLVVCVAYSAIDLTSAQSVLGECVNETLVLGAACKAKPQHPNFFKLIEGLIEKDTALLVLELTIPDVDPNVRKRHRFDLVKTDLGETLLTLKSQLEFLTINLPLLSDRVDRQPMELIPSPPGCLTNITITDALVKNWLLCGLTKDKDGVKKLLVKKVCLAKPYEEPDDWFLFRDTYYHECTETSIKDSDWIMLNEDPLVRLGKRILNYGVTIITILCVIILTMYRRLFQTKARLFLFKLHQPKTKTCEVVERSSCESDEVQLSPNKINFPAFKFERCKFVCSGGRRSDRWKQITTEKTTYKLNITGFWFDIERDALISQNSFGLVSLLQASVEEISDTVCKWCKRCCCVPRLCTCLHLLLHILFCMIVTAGVLVPVFLFYKCDPFHTLLDGIVSLLIFIVVPISMVVTKATLGFCRHEIVYSAQLIILEVTFFFLAYFIVAILARVIVIILVGLALKSGSDIYTLVSSTVLFVSINGYKQLQKTHTEYLEFLDKCMKHIPKSVDESNTLNARVFKNRVVPSDPGDETGPTQKEKKLFLTLKGFVLFYLPNGESAINRDFFLNLCRDDTSHSPGDLRWNFLMGILKFIFWGIVVSGILFVQHMVAKNFDSSLYSQAPAAVLGGLIPIFFDSVLFPEHKKAENTNLTRLLNNAATKFKKDYYVADFEMDNDPSVYDNDQPPNVWQKICIEKSRCTGCCCIQGETEELSDEQTTERIRVIKTEAEKPTEEDETCHGKEAEEGRAKDKGHLSDISGIKGGLKNPTFNNDSDNRV